MFSLPRRVIRPLADFMRQEAGAGLLLVIAALIALVWANSPLADAYVDLWTAVVNLPGTTLDLSVRHWVNDGAMVVFFYVVGLEIKRELTEGELRDPRQAALPIIAAFGGMILPAVIFALIVGGGDGSKGWGIPMATDIAIVTGAVALIGRRAPPWLALFLLALAVVDDIGAIMVIAVFYSEGVSFGWLAVAFATLAAAATLRRFVPWVPVLVVLGPACWFALHEAHVHPTLAGVAFGMLTPLAPAARGDLVDASDNEPHGSVSVLEWLEHRLHPWSAYLIVPVFALANAGVAVPADSISDALRSSVTWGVVVGLVVGKMVGIASFTLLAVKTGVGRLPAGVTRRHVIGAGALGGIGFTVSLFVTELAFGDRALGRDARLGVLVGSVLAASFGTTVLLARRGATPERSTPEALAVR